MSKKSAVKNVDSDILSKATINPWVRIAGPSTTPNREVDVVQIEKLLAERTAAKLIKNFEVADRIAKALQDQHLAYTDEQKTWYTKPIPAAVSQTEDTKESNKSTSGEKKRKMSKSEGNEKSESDGAGEETKPRKKKTKKV